MNSATPVPAAVGQLDIETCLVGLAFSAALRLQLAFERESSETVRRALLLAAGDLVDTTLPSPELKEQLVRERPSDALAFLIEHRSKVAAIPPGLWRKARVAPNELGSEHYAGLRATLRALKKDFSTPEKLWSTLEDWLSPAWQRQPGLKAEYSSYKSLAEGGQPPGEPAA